jgi:osmotically-inducible protein OsmY
MRGSAFERETVEGIMRTIRTIVLSLLVVLIAFVAFTYLSGTAWTPFAHNDRPATIGTAGSVETAKERGAEMGEKVAIAAAKVKEEAGEAALTSKIKAKMVLDDNIKARAIDVTTNGATVTLSGTVRTVDEHDRAVRLARETAGVTQVVDHLRVEVK